MKTPEFIQALEHTIATHPWLGEVSLVLLFTLLAQLAWMLFARHSSEREMGLRRSLLHAFIRSSSPAIMAVIAIIGFSLLLQTLGRELWPALTPWIGPLRMVAVALVVVWGTFRFIDASERLHLENGYDTTTANALSMLFKVITLVVVFLAVGQSFGMSLSGLLAFGGAGGLVVGFAAKDILANFFGGLMIFIDKPFKVGDWVSSPDRNIDGTVEHIGWRLTRILTFDNRPMYIPNSIFSSIGVVNPQRMKNRRILVNIGLRYEDAGRMAEVVDKVRAMLRAHPAIDQNDTLLVYFNQFGESSISFMVYCFTRTTSWEPWLAAQQDVYLKIVDIVHACGADFAFPSRTLYVEGTGAGLPLA
ncbi:mechanosensitive ion channel family protein [Craterilacuibacter sinensis]|nr:mechanosensitive ion channel family protein [Craterilacuibacter sinensis]